MNHSTDIQDYMIADEISRIQKLDRENLERELIELRSREIETSNFQ